MDKKAIILIVTIVSLVALAAGGWYIYPIVFHADEVPEMADTLVIEEEQPVAPLPEQDAPTLVAEETPDLPQTRSIIRVAEVPCANERLVGYWVNDENPDWHRAYYDDEDEDEPGVFWGKEWNEDEGVKEEDLSWHGNGWFKWQYTKNQIIERHRMEHNQAEIPVEYTVQKLTDNELVLIEQRQSHKVKHIFHKQ